MVIMGLHGISTQYSNVRTDIRIAGETGYQAVEVVGSKLRRYVDAGFKIEDVLPLLDAHSLQVDSLNDVKDVERQEPGERHALLDEAEWLCSAAETLHSPTIQLVLDCGLQGRPWPEIIRLTARNVAAIADIGRRHGVRFKLEPAAWAPIHSLSRSLQLIEEVGRDNVGVSMDFWHLWAGGETTPDEVARLPGSLTECMSATVCAARRARGGTRTSCGRFSPGRVTFRPRNGWMPCVLRDTTESGRAS